MAKSDTYRIYLADLNHELAGFAYPLNVAYLAAYVLDRHPDAAVKVFKEPEKMLKAMRAAPPDLVGLANYYWNAVLNSRFAAVVRDEFPEAAIIYGGPNISSDDPQRVKALFDWQPFVDVYVTCNGEANTEWLVRKLKTDGLGVDGLKSLSEAEVPFGITLNRQPSFLQGAAALETPGKGDSLDRFPSPYLSGLLDEFIPSRELSPIIETTRGCPFSCAYCCYGKNSMSGLQRFSAERVRSELEYILAHKPGNGYLVMADGNFGINKRDIEIARLLREMHDNHGWPNALEVYFSKTMDDTILEFADCLSPMFTMFTIARQSHNQEALKNVKRKNLKLESAQRIYESAKARGVYTDFEFIYGLPGETLDSFFEGLSTIAKMTDLSSNSRISLYPLLLLEGAELASTESIERFDFRCAFRRTVGAKHAFLGGEELYEAQAVVVGNTTWREEDYFQVRLFHYLMTVFIISRGFISLLAFMKQNGVNEIEFLRRFAQRILLLDRQEFPVLVRFFDELTDKFHAELYFPESYAVPAETISEGLKDKPTTFINIIYTFQLFYGESNAIRRAFFDFLKIFLLEEYDFATPEMIEAHLSYCDSMMIDYNDFKSLKEVSVFSHPLSEVDGNGHSDEVVSCRVDEVVARTWLENDMDDLMHKLGYVYTIAAAGRLDKVVLYQKA